MSGDSSITHFQTAGAPHLPPKRTVGQIMREVCYALVPGILAHVWFFGFGVLWQIAIAAIAALGFEATVLRLRGKPVRLYLADSSALVTAVIFALCVPPLLPWWAGVTAMFFAVVVAKHLYGGIGFNVFNPAMVGFVVVLVAFPKEASQWLPPLALADHYIGPLEAGAAVLFGQLPEGMSWDAITRATPLDVLKTETARNMMLPEIRERPIFGDFGGRGWEWIANLYIAGGLWLLWRRIITWHIPLAMIGAVIAVSLPFYLVDPTSHPVPLQHVFSGGVVLGAFFVATDPVSASTTPRGRLIYAAGIGVLTLVIRRWGGYPDGVAFSVLLMNMAVPLIDAHTKPRVYGQ